MQQTVYRGYKYRAYPTPEQAELIRQNIGSARYLWNQYVTQGKEQDKAKQPIKPSSYTIFKQDAEWLKDADSCALNNVKLAYQRSWDAYYTQPNHGKPKYKSKKKAKATYKTTNNKTYDKNGTPRYSLWLRGHHIKLPKIKEPILIKKHRNLPRGHHIIDATIEEERRDVFYITLTIAYDINVPESLPVRPDEMIGFDYSSPSFYVDDQGNSPDCKNWYREAESHIAWAQSRKDMKNYGSNNWWLAKNHLKKIHAKPRHQREDFVHQESAAITKQYSIVFAEDLNLRAMAGSLRLGKSTNDNGFGKFRECLSYKLFEKGGALVKVPRSFASSKTCSCCGYKHSGLGLSDREWICPSCGAHHDRDRNAGVNIRVMGLFGLIVEGYISRAVIHGGGFVDLRGLFLLDSAAPDYEGLLGLVESGYLAGGAPVMAYVLGSLTSALGEGNECPSGTIILSAGSAREFITAKKNRHAAVSPAHSTRLAPCVVSEASTSGYTTAKSG